MGKTGFISGYAVRGLEIKEWLGKHREIEDYVVVDDDAFDIVNEIPKDKFIHVKDGWYRGGLTRAQVENYLIAGGFNV